MAGKKKGQGKQFTSMSKITVVLELWDVIKTGAPDCTACLKKGRCDFGGAHKYKVFGCTIPIRKTDAERLLSKMSGVRHKIR